MILALDIGNTDVKLAAFADTGKIVAEDRFSSATDFAGIARRIAAFQERKFQKILLASVVPALTGYFSEILSPHTNLLHIVGPQSPWGFSIETAAPEKTGTDRLANIEGALRYGAFAIVVDAGTATKFDVLEGPEKKRFPGGAIAPGVGISYEALHARTAQLPLIDLEKHSPVLGYDTETAIRSGVLHGFASQVDGMVWRLFQERDLPPQTAVIATGGYSRFLAGRAKLITRLAPKLTMEGLYGLAQKL